MSELRIHRDNICPDYEPLGSWSLAMQNIIERASEVANLYVVDEPTLESES